MKYAVLFRGINVGGKNVVKMEDLRKLLTDLGLGSVKTYIQSGNAVFETTLDEAVLLKKIKDAFREHFGFESNAMVRSEAELRELIERFPFSEADIAAAEAADPQVEHQYVYFLDKAPTQETLDLLCERFSGDDKAKIANRELYFLCHQSIRKAKLAAGLRKLFPSATVRNWNTMRKMYYLMKTM